MRHYKNKKRILALLLAGILGANGIFSLSACGQGVKEGEDSVASSEEKISPYKEYTGPYSETDGTYGGVDDLGRVLSDDTTVGQPRKDRYVGIFYFLWQGEHGTGGPYDNTKIVEGNPDAVKSEEAWLASGGGGVGEHHFWGEPLFGYYTSKDIWVMRKHCQMLTDAGVDYICFDTTNAFTYSDRVKELIAVWYEYLEQGYDVPKLVFYTNSYSGATMTKIYNEIYADAELKAKYPRIEELWFNWDGKPLIIGDKTDTELSAEAAAYFRIKANQWPNEAKKADGFPWMEFTRLLKMSAVYGLDDRREVMNVSIAQHNATIRFSSTAWYGGTDRTRSFIGNKNSTKEGAYLHGYNFAKQWDYAISKDPEMVFVTGWNEWVAQRQPSFGDEAIVFVDCADYNTSRDAEPMRGYFGDNYYMQLIDYIRQYKGTAPRVYVGEDISVDIKGGFEQWDAEAVTARYTDYKNDTAKRDAKGFGGISYVNTSGRNDIISAKAARDTDKLYFYVETAEAITPYTDGNWMTLFLSTGRDEGWHGYDYAVNLVSPESPDKAWLCRLNAEGDCDEKLCLADMRVEGNKLMLAVPRVAVGLTDELFCLEFKWADNYVKGDIWSFYTEGDAAPYGRLNYVFSNRTANELYSEESAKANEDINN